MRSILVAATLVVVSATSALANGRVVPEIDAFSGLAAMGLIGSIATLLWERGRKHRQ
jgi:hypothetical protein